MSGSNRVGRGILLAVALASLMFATAPAARAVDYYWGGGINGQNLWDDADGAGNTNWLLADLSNSQDYPGGAINAVFDEKGAGNTNVDLDGFEAPGGANFTVTFNTVGSSYTLGDGTLALRHLANLAGTNTINGPSLAARGAHSTSTSAPAR